MEFTENQINELEKLVSNVAEWLQKNGHPHMSITIEQDRCEIKEDVFATLFDGGKHE